VSGPLPQHTIGLHEAECSGAASGISQSTLATNNEGKVHDRNNKVQCDALEAPFERPAGIIARCDSRICRQKVNPEHIW
jgi:hypothetical protein